MFVTKKIAQITNLFGDLDILAVVEDTKKQVCDILWAHQSEM